MGKHLIEYLDFFGRRFVTWGVTGSKERWVWVASGRLIGSCVRLGRYVALTTGDELAVIAPCYPVTEDGLVKGIGSLAYDDKRGCPSG